LFFAAVLVAGCSTAAPSPAPTPTQTPAPTGSSSPAPTAGLSPTTAATPLATPTEIGSSSLTTLHYAGTVEGAPLGYLEYLPPGYGDGELRPLLVFAHGGGENGDGGRTDLPRITATGIPQLLDTDRWLADKPFVVLAPQFEPVPPDELCGNGEQLDAFLDFAVGHYDVDPARVYMTGLSCGAYVGWEYLGQHTDEIVAAAVLIAGDGIEAFEQAGCDLGRVAIWAIHGEADDVVPLNGSVDPIESLNECTDPPPVDARIEVLPNGDHFIWQPFYDDTAGADIYHWMLEHTNPAAE
jgi:predicted peptidase